MYRHVPAPALQEILGVKVLGVREVPCFEMPLRVCVLNARFELAAKTTPQPLSQRMQNLTRLFSIEIYENDILIR